MYVTISAVGCPPFGAAPAFAVHFPSLDVYVNRFPAAWRAEEDIATHYKNWGVWS